MTAPPQTGDNEFVQLQHAIKALAQLGNGILNCARAKPDAVQAAINTYSGLSRALTYHSTHFMSLLTAYVDAAEGRPDAAATQLKELGEEAIAVVQEISPLSLTILKAQKEGAVDMVSDTVEQFIDLAAEFRDVIMSTIALADDVSKVGIALFNAANKLKFPQNITKLGGKKLNRHWTWRTVALEPGVLISSPVGENKRSALNLISSNPTLITMSNEPKAYLKLKKIKQGCQIINDPVYIKCELGNGKSKYFAVSGGQGSKWLKAFLTVRTGLVAAAPEVPVFQSNKIPVVRRGFDRIVRSEVGGEAGSRLSYVPRNANRLSHAPGGGRKRSLSHGDDAKDSGNVPTGLQKYRSSVLLDPTGRPGASGGSGLGRGQPWNPTSKGASALMNKSQQESSSEYEGSGGDDYSNSGPYTDDEGSDASVSTREGSGEDMTRSPPNGGRRGGGVPIRGARGGRGMRGGRGGPAGRGGRGGRGGGGGGGMRGGRGGRGGMSPPPRAQDNYRMQLQREEEQRRKEEEERERLAEEARLRAEEEARARAEEEMILKQKEEERLRLEEERHRLEEERRRLEERLRLEEEERIRVEEERLRLEEEERIRLEEEEAQFQFKEDERGRLEEEAAPSPRAMRGRGMPMRGGRGQPIRGNGGMRGAPRGRGERGGRGGAGAGGPRGGFRGGAGGGPHVNRGGGRGGPPRGGRGGGGGMAPRGGGVRASGVYRRGGGTAGGSGGGGGGGGGGRGRGGGGGVSRPPASLDMLSTMNLEQLDFDGQDFGSRSLVSALDELDDVDFF